MMFSAVPNQKVAVAMSGGVDSAVAALILKEQGYDIIGITMRLWTAGSSEDQVEDARKIAALIGIPHYVLDLENVFLR